VSVIRYRIVS